MTLGKWITAIAIGVLIVVDIVLALVDMNLTFSRVLYSWSQEYPIIALSIGIVMGHIFWPNKGVQNEQSSND